MDNTDIILGCDTVSEDNEPEVIEPKQKYLFSNLTKDGNAISLLNNQDLVTKLKESFKPFSICYYPHQCSDTCQTPCNINKPVKYTEEIIFLRDTLLLVLIQFCGFTKKEEFEGVLKISDEEIKTCFGNTYGELHKRIGQGSSAAVSYFLEFNIDQFKQLVKTKSKLLDKVVALLERPEDKIIKIPLLLRYGNSDVPSDINEAYKWDNFLTKTVVSDFVKNVGSNELKLMDVINLPIFRMNSNRQFYMSTGYVMYKMDLTTLLSRTEIDPERRLVWDDVRRLLHRVASIFDVLHKNELALRNVCLDKFVVSLYNNILNVIVDNVTSLFSPQIEGYQIDGYDSIGYSGARPYCQAPECFNPKIGLYRDAKFTTIDMQRLDIYSLGIVLLQICFQQNIFNGGVIKSKNDEILYGNKSYSMCISNIRYSLFRLKGYVPQNLIDIIHRCVNFDPTKRPTAKELVNVMALLPKNNNAYDAQDLPLICIKYEEDFQMMADTCSEFYGDDINATNVKFVNNVKLPVGDVMGCTTGFGNNMIQ